MASPFEAVILRLADLGFFQFLLPFTLTSAIFYGALRKSQIFGEPEKNVAVNGVVSLVASMMVWAAPIILGIDIQTSLATFFVQGLFATLVIMVGLVIVGMFAPPDLSKTLAEKLGNKYLGIALVIGLVIGLGLFLTSGLVNFLIPGGISGNVEIDQDTMILAVFAILMVVVILFIVGGSAVTGKS
ncbi:MAG TPA: hypothetical protein VJJ76_02365 [archaeon]|nr:hypothetical protein [archaeon]